MYSLAPNHTVLSNVRNSTINIAAARQAYVNVFLKRQYLNKNKVGGNGLVIGLQYNVIVYTVQGSSQAELSIYVITHTHRVRGGNIFNWLTR